MFRRLFTSIPRESRSFYTATVAMALFLSFALQVQSMGAGVKMINRQIFHPLVFNLRSLLRSESLDPRIHILAYDDSTAAYFKSSDLPLPDWGALIHKISATGQITVVIDKLFDITSNAADTQLFIDHLKSISNSKTALIAFANPASISYRDEINAGAIDALEKKVFLPSTINPAITAKIETSKIYGAAPNVIQSFSVFGIANYRGDNYIDPFCKLANGALIPHVILSSLGGLDLSRTQVEHLHQKLPLNHQGRLLINFQKPQVYRQKTMALLPFVARVKRDIDLQAFKPGDFVVILPAMFTGHTDFVDSPFGPIPGGFHLVALLQSALTNTWVTEIEDTGFFVIALAIIGFLMGVWLKPPRAGSSIVLLALGITILSVVAFVYFNISWSSVLPVSGLIVGGLHGAILRGHQTALEEARKTRELDVAALVQKSFFPRDGAELIRSQNCSIIGKYQPASECGGDWWGSFSYGGFTYLLIGDAVGHGVPAALVTSVAYAVSRSIEIGLGRMTAPLKPSEILEEFNKILISIGSALTQMTFFVARIDERSGECLYANAGNHPPYWISTDSSHTDSNTGNANPKLTILSSAGNILGEYTYILFENHAIQLASGDKLIFFTDGLYENRTANESSQLGKNWLKNTIQKYSQLEVNDLIGHIWSDYESAIGLTPPDDDTTLVGLQFTRMN